MATKGCDSTAHHHSSIALLQERFRQLQRAKEMRKEKELLRLFSEPPPETTRTANNHGSKRFEPTGLFFHSESLLPHHTRPVQPPQYQGSIYLQPNLQSKQAGFQGGETGPVFANINGSSAGSAMSYNMAYNLDDSDVDTSLHL